ncbi:MAG: hypothetical protein GTO40_03585 [Deltaproteobacteria bacterium]|nr:hypothetical protein [Deltaproteobacteria bacterium]
MTDQTIVEYGKEKGIRKQILERWSGLPEADRFALLELARGLNIGENHLRELLDWAEEISLRDGVGLYGLIKGPRIEPIWSDPRLGRADKLRRIKEEMRRLRFPRLVKLERDVQNRIRSLGLGSQIQLSVPQGLEGGALTIQLTATSVADLRKLSAELNEVLERSEIVDIFDCLNGRAMQ